MTRSVRSQRMKGGCGSPEACCVHKLLHLTETESKSGAEIIRAYAAPGTARALAIAKLCPNERSWHIFIPTPGRARTIHRKLRQKSETPKDGKTDE